MLYLPPIGSFLLLHCFVIRIPELTIVNLYMPDRIVRWIVILHLLQNDLVEMWEEKGVPGHKMVLGMPFFGRSYRLEDPAISMPGAPAIGPGTDNGDGIPLKHVIILLC